MNGGENTNVSMPDTMHDFFFTVGIGTTAGIGYYYWNNVYPITIGRLLADTVWWSIRLHAQTNMYLDKFYTATNPFIRMFIAESERQDVRFFKSGLEICSMPYLDALNYNEDTHGKYDKVSYELEDDNKNVYLIIRDNVDDITDRDIKKSTTHFINVTLKREGEEDMEIDMKSRGNIYMTGNELFTKEFFEWMCPGIKLNGNYVVSTIDNNVSIVEFNSNQYIVLNANGYEIKKNENPEIEKDSMTEPDTSSWLFGSFFSKSKDD